MTGSEKLNPSALTLNHPPESETVVVATFGSPVELSVIETLADRGALANPYAHCAIEFRTSNEYVPSATEPPGK